MSIEFRAGLWVLEVLAIEVVLSIVVFDRFFWEHEQVAASEIVLFVAASIITAGVLLFYHLWKLNLDEITARSLVDAE